VATKDEIAVWLRDDAARQIVGAQPSEQASRWVVKGVRVGDELGVGFWLKAEETIIRELRPTDEQTPKHVLWGFKSGQLFIKWETVLYIQAFEGEAKEIGLADPARALATHASLEIRSQLRRALPQHRVVGDRVAVVNLHRPVTDHPHGSGAGDAGPLEVPHGGSPEVMDDPARAAGGPTGRFPRLAEALDRMPVADELARLRPEVAVEHQRDDDAVRPLSRLHRRPLGLQRGPELGGHDEFLALAGLRGADVQADHASFEVHPRPGERQDLRTDAPPARTSCAVPTAPD
jgi:hypothetical protein